MDHGYKLLYSRLQFLPNNNLSVSVRRLRRRKKNHFSKISRSDLESEIRINLISNNQHFINLIDEFDFLSKRTIKKKCDEYR